MTMNMKRKILSAALFVAIAVAAGWNFNQSENEMVMSDLALANVEALAGGESSDCPNGCLTSPGKCNCRGEHPYKEAKWK